MKPSLASKFIWGLLALQPASARYVMYVDQWHLTELPNRTVTAGIDTVIMAFANSSLFVSPPGDYTPFEPVEKMRSRFDNGTKVLIALGGWGDTAGFGVGAATETSRADFAKNVARIVTSHGYDGVDVDWEYPGGNGADYKQNPNSGKLSEVETFPLLLAAIKSAIGDKLLSIAVPGLQRDMIAYTPEKAKAIWKSVDFVNIMTYDLMNRRDNITKHHTSVIGSLEVIEHYLDILSLPAKKAILGFPFYAKYFTTDPAYPCENGLGCKTVLLEDPEGVDTGKSAAITFEKANYASAPGNLTETTDGSCGANVAFRCKAGDCCSAYGYCGSTADYCGTNCLSDYGRCDGTSIGALFNIAMANGITDEAVGGQYYFDKENSIFWTWDTPALIKRKFQQIVYTKGLGGVMAWSAGEDSQDWSHILALQAGVRGLRTSSRFSRHS